MSNAIFNAENLFFSYGRNTIITGLNLTVQPGAVIGIVGKNGCGKTTFLKLVCGFLLAKKGKISISTEGKAAVPSISGVIETPKLLDNLSGDENLRYYLEKQYCREKVDAAFKMWQLSEYADVNVRNYSLGMRQKIGLMIAFLSEAPLLVFDEPTNSLDFESVEIFYECVRNASASGRAIIIVTHLMYELNKNCTEIFELNNGKLVKRERKKVDGGSYEIGFVDAGTAQKAAKKLDASEVLSINGDTLTVSNSKRSISDLLRAVMEFDVVSVQALESEPVFEGGCQ